ncbi:MAG: 50S ribosomal protein L9 [Bifidobacteriaceae bacterium]|jgi:large subunit ribosomal protein L9|nr:50S ribosomal protein L9 [Bifidobacteriaceae bacterium]
MAKIILTKKVKDLGTAGDVVTVKDGFFRNYLAPQKYAILWTKGAEKDIESIKAARAKRQIETIEAANEVKAKISAGVTIKMKVGKTGKLFGSVNAASVVEAIKDTYSVELDKHAIDMKPIKESGSYVVTVDLHNDVQVELPVLIKKA